MPGVFRLIYLIYMYDYFYFIAGVLFRIFSEVAISDDDYSPLFRVDGGSPDVTVRVSVADSPLSCGVPVAKNSDLRISRDGDKILSSLMLHDSDRVLSQAMYSATSSDFIDVFLMADESPNLARTVHIWSVIDICFTLLKKKRAVIHSSSIAVDGRAILFAAPSGTGKSTQAGIWQALRGAEVLNGDKNCVCFDPSSSSAVALGLPFCGTSGICSQYRLPLSAIVLLRQARENSARYLSGIAALSAIARNCMGFGSLPETMLLLSDVLAEVIPHISVIELACTPDVRAVELLENFLPR